MVVEGVVEVAGGGQFVESAVFDFPACVAEAVDGRGGVDFGQVGEPAPVGSVEEFFFLAILVESGFPLFFFGISGVPTICGVMFLLGALPGYLMMRMVFPNINFGVRVILTSVTLILLIIILWMLFGLYLKATWPA